MKEAARTHETMTLSEADAFIRVSEKTLGEMARARRVPSQKVGREWRFLRRALEEWLTGEMGLIASGQTDAVYERALSITEPAMQYELPFSGFRDTAFTENHDHTLHRWVPWIAGFSGSFVADVLAKMERKHNGLRVLDPFAGVGTTLIEALKHGSDAIGFEINPYAALACKVKINAATYDVGLLEEMIDRFEEHGEEKLGANNGEVRSVPPTGFVSRVPFFSPSVERQVLICLDFIEQETTDWLRELFQTAFGAVMVSFSNYSYEPSLGTRAAAGKPDVDHADVIGVVKRKLREMREDVLTFQRWTAELGRAPRATIYPESYFDAAGKVKRHRIDVLITSPPYLNNYHYIRNTRPHMFWLGMVRSSADLKAMERKNFGQFWQTVRSGPDVVLKPHLPGLAERIAELKEQNVEKGAYGGPGWANYASSYFNDCQKFCEVTLEVMKPGGTAVIVIGNNILQGIEFQTDRLFAEIAQQQGFEIVKLHEVRKKRTGTSIVNSSVRAGTVKQKTRLYETAIEMRAPHTTNSSSR